MTRALLAAAISLAACAHAPASTGSGAEPRPNVAEPAPRTAAPPVGVPPSPGATPTPTPSPPPREPSSAADGSSADVVGLAVPLSGKYRAWGEAIADGVALALEGTGRRAVAKDTRGEPDGAAQALAELRAEGAVAVIGGVTAAEALPAARAAQELGLPLVSLARVEGVPAAGPFVFRTMLTAEAQARALADLAMGRRGLKRFALLWPTTAYGQELAQAFWTEVEAKGGEIRGAEQYDPERTNFAPLVRSLTGKAQLEERADYRDRAKEISDNEKDPFRRRKALQKLRENLPPITDFDAVFLPDFARTIALVAPALAVEDVVTATCDPREVERVRKTTGRDDVQPVQLLGSNGWDDPSLVEKAGRYVQCAVFVDGFFAGSDRPETKRFVEAFQGRFGRPPTILEASAYDATGAIAQVLARGATNRDQARAGLARLTGFAGATGTFSFDERREIAKPLFFLTVDGAAIRELRPEELARPGAG
jgi:ABC-type branched-subunit amino acid transport system substrate-binding protein